MPKDTIQDDNLQQDIENNLIFPCNFTQIPNIVFDYWMPILSNTEFKVLLYICRETFGWQRAKKNISLKCLGEKTGLSKSTVCTSLKKLIELKLVISIHSKPTHGDDDVNGYYINVRGVVQNLDNVVQNLGGSPK